MFLNEILPGNATTGKYRNSRYFIWCVNIVSTVFIIKIVQIVPGVY